MAQASNVAPTRRPTKPKRASKRRRLKAKSERAEIEAAYDLFANQRDGVLKVAITP